MSCPALLVHSGGFTSRQWRKLAAALAPRTVLAPDLLGYGEPWPAGQPFHFRQDVERLVGVVDEQDTRVHVVGHSYGGFLALHVALARPERVRSIAVYEPVAFGVLGSPEDDDALAAIASLPGYRPDSDGADEAWLRAFVDWWNGPGAWSGLLPDTQHAFRSVAWKLSQEVASLVRDATRYSDITAPTLVLGGTQTQPAELRVVERLAAALPAATLRILPDLGHMGPITHAAVVNGAIAAHIAAYD
ncbi:MAG TPA: alpha/beta hydrolase [Kofleriaceae bacterium]|nr:alpha/beta hydrolase [Kofleriaceae bacterium]